MRAKKRQKLYSGVKKRSDTRQKTAKTLQERANGANRKCEQSTEPEETAESLQRRKETVGCAPKNDRNFTGVYRKGQLRAKK